MGAYAKSGGTTAPMAIKISNIVIDCFYEAKVSGSGIFTWP